MTREYTVVVDHEEYTCTIDDSDYPEIIIEGTVNENGEEIDPTPELLCDLLDALSVDIAGDRCDAAHDFAKGD